MEIKTLSDIEEELKAEDRIAVAHSVANIRRKLLWVIDLLDSAIADAGRWSDDEETRFEYLLPSPDEAVRAATDEIEEAKTILLECL